MNFRSLFSLFSSDLAIDLGTANTLVFAANKGIVGAAFHSNRVIVVHDAYGDPRFNASVDASTGFRTRSIMATPMVDIDGVPIGVIESVNKVDRQFTAEDQALVQLLADQSHQIAPDAEADVVVVARNQIGSPPGASHQNVFHRVAGIDVKFGILRSRKDWAARHQQAANPEVFHAGAGSTPRARGKQLKRKGKGGSPM